ncbi:hypothetical protein CBL_12423 [Carabus blaptoides fortunei]
MSVHIIDKDNNTVQERTCIASSLQNVSEQTSESGSLDTWSAYVHTCTNMLYRQTDSPVVVMADSKRDGAEERIWLELSLQSQTSAGGIRSTVLCQADARVCWMVRGVCDT